ncbi:MAG: TonB-dependent receptor [Gammaproteobacteria bacterium]|nr:TonB-dependent receptor [Gammaproteobacteria bacterium]MBQ0839156.1 TonB-dependent receptor [Gammaproteobacteria bacterium]
MLTKHYLPFLLSLSLLQPLIAKAEDERELADFFGDEEFISIATGLTQPLSKAPAVASVITAQEISQIGATDIDEILETVPGLHVSRNIGYSPIYSFRGIHTTANPQVLMLINGIPLTNLFHGDRNLVWGGMPVEAISRIEIIRGPGSAIYGADAFAGVINIITQSSSEVNGTSVGLRYGTSNSKNFWLQTGGAIGELAYMAIIEGRKTDGSSEKINSDSQSVLDFLSGTNASLAPGSINQEGEAFDTRLELTYKDLTFRAGSQIRNNEGLGAGIARALDPSGQAASKRYNADITYEKINLTPNTGIKANISYLQTSQEVADDFILLPPGTTGSPLNPIPYPDGIIGNPEIYEHHYRASLTSTFRGIERHELMAGVGYYFGEIYKVEEEKNFGIDPATGLPIFPGSPLVDVSDTPFIFLNENERENSYAFVQDVWHLADDWEFTAGLRFDHYSDFGDTANPRAALVWSARHNLTVKALYGEAFRAPSFAETGEQANPAFLGNPDLKPETLKSYELAFNYKPTYDLTIDLNLFQYYWKDIIHFIPTTGGSGTHTAQNAGEQEGHGLELEASWQVNDYLSVLSNYSWQKSEDELTNADAANAPEQQFYIRANTSLPQGWNISLQANRVMSRNRTFDDPRQDIDDYTTVDFTLRKSFLTDQLELSLITKNLFNDDAREPSLNGQPVPAITDDLPLDRRRIFGEIRYKL